jgi:hypothetical protein
MPNGIDINKLNFTAKETEQLERAAQYEGREPVEWMHDALLKAAQDINNTYLMNEYLADPKCAGPLQVAMKEARREVEIDAKKWEKPAGKC